MIRKSLSTTFINIATVVAIAGIVIIMATSTTTTFDGFIRLGEDMIRQPL